MKQEFDFQASHAEMVFAKMRAEDALKRSERECEELRLKNTKLEEEKRVMIENNRSQVLKVKKETKVTEARQIEALISEHAAKLAVMKKREKECVDLIGELEEKLLRLEEENKLHAVNKSMLVDREARVEEKYRKLVDDRKSEEEIHRVKVSELEREKRNADGLVEMYKRSEIELAARVSQLEKAVEFFLVEPQETPEDDVGDTITRGGPPSVGVVVIDSDDEEMVDTEASGHGYQSAGLHGNLCSSVPTPAHANTSAVLKPCTEQPNLSNSEDDWKSEKDIRLALMKDPELCMLAVCALYKKQCFEAKFGYDAHALRGTNLAEFLTDKLPQCVLKKSITELRKHDYEGLNDCKRVAMKHSEKLFQIYIKYGDPRFRLT